MFNFINSIVIKITTAITSVLITIGLVSTPIPTTQTEPWVSTSTQEPSIVVELERGSGAQEAPKITVVPPSEKTIVELSKTAQTTPPQEEKKTAPSIPQITIIQEPIPPLTIPPANTSKVALEIFAVNVVPDLTSVKIEWQTNLATESKAFVFKDNQVVKTVVSETNPSTRHFVNVSGLSSQTNYSYELESVIASEGRVIKKTGSFTTLTPPPPPPPIPILEFTPLIRFGTDSGQLGKVYFTINEDFNSGTYSLRNLNKNTSVPPTSYSTTPGKELEVDLKKYGMGNYEYQLSMSRDGYQSNTKAGTFSVPNQPLIYVKKSRTFYDSFPELHGEFFFYHWGGAVNEASMLNLKILVTLTNPQIPNELKFYRSGIANLIKTFSNVSNGDILEIESFPSNYQLVWSFSGNPDDLTLKLIDGAATKNGVPVSFDYYSEYEILW